MNPDKDEVAYYRAVAGDILAKLQDTETIEAASRVIDERFFAIVAMRKRAPEVFSFLDAEVEKYRNTLPTEA